MNIAMLGTCKTPPRGPRVGFMVAGGGEAVTFTDLAALGGLTLPELQKDTQELISQKISAVNTSTPNPVDLGMFGLDFNVMSHTIMAMAQDDCIDVIIPFLSVDFISTFQRDQIEDGPGIIIEAAKKAKSRLFPFCQHVHRTTSTSKRPGFPCFLPSETRDFPCLRPHRTVSIRSQSILNGSANIDRNRTGPQSVSRTAPR